MLHIYVHAAISCGCHREFFIKHKTIYTSKIVNIFILNVSTIKLSHLQKNATYLQSQLFFKTILFIYFIYLLETSRNRHKLTVTRIRKNLNTHVRDILMHKIAICDAIKLPKCLPQQAYSRDLKIAVYTANG